MESRAAEDDAAFACGLVQQGRDLDLQFAKSLSCLIHWSYTARLEIQRKWASGCVRYLESKGHHMLAQRIQELLDQPGKKLQTIVLDPQLEEAKSEMQIALMPLADRAISNATNSGSSGFDVMIQDANRQYLAHKSILVTRSNYFQTRFNLTSFREADNQHDQFEGHIVKLQMDQASPDTWPTIIRWAYTELVSEESTEGLVEVLLLADRLVCEGLRQKCGAVLRSHVTFDNVLPLLAIAIALGLEPLSKTCCRVLAEHLPELIHEPQLAELVHESAASIQEREDVDSVPIIDDIRYYNAQLYPHKIAWEGDPDFDEEGNVICKGEEHFVKLSPFKKRLVLLQDLLIREGLEA